jgi:hypothetical protein
MGGLIVWGVKATRDANGVDCATALVPIAEIERFKADITRLVSQAIMPRHEGIFVEAIPAKNSRGAGYLVIHVERSEHRPHRCEFDKRYYKRSGDSSIMMEHYDIEDSFRRLVVPWLELRWEVRLTGVAAIGSGVRFHTPHINIFLRNPSPVTARFPFLILREVGGINPEAVGSFSGFVHQSYGGDHHFAGGVDLVIHPELSLHVTQLSTPQIEARRGTDGQFRVQWEGLHSVRASYQCGCYNSRHTVGQLLVTPQEFLPPDLAQTT